MATPKTECTELSVGFGLIGLDPVEALPIQIDQLWNESLPISKFIDFKRKFLEDEPYYRRFYNIGVNLCHSHSVFKDMKISLVRWEGPQQQAGSVTIPVDIIAANIPISIKADSNVVFNLSPPILFDSVPRASLSPTRSDNWYLTVAPDSYQKLYELANNLCTLSLPYSVQEYHETVRGAKKRKLLAKAIRNLSPADLAIFNKQYRAFCHQVATHSAALFHDNLKATLAGQLKNAVTENIIRRFFRMSDSEYVLCGSDQRNDFCVTIPPLTEWKRKWRFKQLTAHPDLSRGQSVVNFEIVVAEKASRQEYTFPFHAEIRWSHGKFSGNPEAKLYKDFAWIEAPFFSPIY